MGKPTGFLEYARQEKRTEAVADRVLHYHEFVTPLSDATLRTQGARCMDCGIPFCHSSCPLHNMIPDWNDLVYQDDWQKALDILHSTNNFPEFTGRICPAPCEAACTLNLIDSPVAIKTIECAIIDKAWAEGWIHPEISHHKTKRHIAVIGSGPAGLACAQQLARAGHFVSLFEKQDRIGGLLRYGIPDFKLSKHLIDRRMAQMRAEGVEFHTNVHVGVDISATQLTLDYDAIVLAGGSEKPRDLSVTGRELKQIHFAMDFLRANSKKVQGVDRADECFISAEKRHVVVIGGGDTGSDCIGTAIRHGAQSVTQLEILPMPPEKEDKALTWPHWPNRLRTSSSQEEGCVRLWSVATKAFIGDEHGYLKKLNCIKLNWQQDANGKWQMTEIPDSEFSIEADLVLLAMGFVHPVHDGMLQELGVELNAHGNVASPSHGHNAYQTNIAGIFSAGDMRRGQSLVVWAIHEGRQCARAVDEWLMGQSNLPA